MIRYILIPFCFFFLQCNGQNIKQIDNYYFPFKNFLNERSFCYVNQNDTSEKAIWKMKTIIVNHDTIFQTRIFTNGSLSEFINEKVENGSSKIISYKLYNEGNESKCLIVDSLIYKQNQNNSEEIKWRVTFKDFYSENKLGLTKIRKVKSKDEKNVIFSDEMTMEIIGTTKSYNYGIESVYESGKGLISYYITRPNGQNKYFKFSYEE